MNKKCWYKDMEFYQIKTIWNTCLSVSIKNVFIEDVLVAMNKGLYNESDGKKQELFFQTGGNHNEKSFM